MKFALNNKSFIPPKPSKKIFLKKVVKIDTTYKKLHYICNVKP